MKGFVYGFWNDGPTFEFFTSRKLAEPLIQSNLKSVLKPGIFGWRCCASTLFPLRFGSGNMSGEVGVLQTLFRDWTKKHLFFYCKSVGNWKFKIDGMGKVQWASLLPYLWSISACWGPENLWIVQQDWLNRSEFNWNLEHFPNNYLKKEKQRWWLSKSIFHPKNFSCPFGSWGSVLSWIVASKKECLLSKILSVICWKIWSIK